MSRAGASGSAANAAAQQLRTAVSASSGPTSAIDENAPDQSGSPSSGLEERTITRPPSLATAAVSSSRSTGSSGHDRAARRAAAGSPPRTAAAAAASAGRLCAHGTTQPGSTGAPARMAVESRAAFAPMTLAAAAVSSGSRWRKPVAGTDPPVKVFR